MEIKKFDVVIVGAGPAGCAAAYMLSGKGLKIALLDKDIFPRDKICGDALGADVAKQFHAMGGGLAQKMEKFPAKIPSNGVRFYTPDNKTLDIKFNVPEDKFAGGFVARRIDFDNFFFTEIVQLPDVEIFQGQQVNKVIIKEDCILLQTTSYSFEATISLGADGAHSVLNKQLTDNKVERNHYAAGLRQYYRNVTGFTDENHIELHFNKDILPGYLWIFPLPNNQANVGIGMLSRLVSEKKVNIKEKMEQLIRTHPLLKERFKDAVPMETVRGFGLPLGSKKRNISGDRFLLLGDAAGLIDPFTGEGIANAIRSGRIAATHVLHAIEQKNFSAAFNKQYDKEIYHKMWKEFRFGHSMQKLFRHPKLINFVAKKAHNNQAIQMLLSCMLNDIDIKKELAKPSFYFKLLFK